MSRRRGGRTRGRRRSKLPLAVVALALAFTLLAPTYIAPQGAYSTADMDRSTDLSVVGDENGGVGIKSYHKLNTGETCNLVTVTNNFDTLVTVTVALRDDSTHYGNLTLGDGRLGNTTTFDLGAGSQEDVGLETKDDTSFDDDNVYYHVDVTDAPVTVAANDRYSTIDDDQITTDCDITI